MGLIQEVKTFGMVLWCYGVMVLWCYGVMVLRCYGVMVLWCYGVMVLWCYGYGVMVLWLRSAQLYSSSIVAECLTNVDSVTCETITFTKKRKSEQKKKKKQFFSEMFSETYCNVWPESRNTCTIKEINSLIINWIDTIPFVTNFRALLRYWFSDLLSFYQINSFLILEGARTENPWLREWNKKFLAPLFSFPHILHDFKTKH